MRSNHLDDGQESALFSVEKLSRSTWRETILRMVVLQISEGVLKRYENMPRLLDIIWYGRLPYTIRWITFI
jgi:hypothetical protein